MRTCINTLNITATPKVTSQILCKGFENSDTDDWGFSPQNFSFLPFVKSQHPDSPWQDNLWTRWVEETPEDKKKKQAHSLCIEFESEGEPPTFAIDAMIAWLNEQDLDYQLKLDYQPEGGQWAGEINAQSH